MELVRECLTVDPAWVGAGISTESKRSYELRMAMIQAQRTAMDRLDRNYPTHMKVHWLIQLADKSEWVWNPQMGVPEDAKELVFVICELEHQLCPTPGCSKKAGHPGPCDQRGSGGA